MLKNKIAVIMYGAPGSGKSTQAELLARKIDLFHFDTGDYLRKILFSSSKLSAELIKERKTNKSGKLNTPSWVFKIVSQRIKELSKLGQSIVLSGSPRTLYEAFGLADDLSETKKHKIISNSGGIFKLLEKEYKKKNIHIFALDIPEQESIKRNSNRVSCSVCKLPILSQISSKESKFPIGQANVKCLMSNCPFCGGKIEHRKDDNKKIITDRLTEYHKRTEPIFNELEKKKFNFYKINGTLKPYMVHQKILEYFL